jgi:quercetin dioxygenase-like cupin family protein
MATVETGKATLLKKNLGSPEERREFISNGKVDIVKLNDVTVGRGVFEPGWRWSEHVKPIAGTESCQSAHLGYVLAGRMKVRMNDGQEAEVSEGDAFVIAPGHDAWTVGQQACELLDFTGMTAYAKRGESS